MKHHLYNPNFKFIQEPIDFTKKTDKKILQYCLGATLYMPATKNVLDKIVNIKFKDITSMVMCFEDAIQESELSNAEINVLFHLDKIADAIEEEKLKLDEVPLIFLRVRNLDQFENF